MSMFSFGKDSTFIWASYAISMVILIWTALRPLLRERSLRRMLRNALRQQEQNS